MQWKTLHYWQKHYLFQKQYYQILPIKQFFLSYFQSYLLPLYLYLIEAITLAAAGGQNLLMIGESGCRKTMIAQRIPTLFVN
ncbi:hypothetical protein GPK96_11010 [Blautia sp. MCC289]|nr:hypothetical protein [Blautia sp. MCC289]